MDHSKEELERAFNASELRLPWFFESLADIFPMTGGWNLLEHHQNDDLGKYYRSLNFKAVEFARLQDIKTLEFLNLKFLDAAAHFIV
jgi:hypothetical protein